MQMNHGTSIYAIITKQAIVVGADGQGMSMHGFPIPPEGFLKLMPVHKRLVVTCEGMGAFTGYCFHEWVRIIESKLPSDLEASALATAIESVIAEPFRQAFTGDRNASKAMLEYCARKSYLANFFIAYDFILRRVTLSVDVPQWTVVANTTVEYEGTPIELPFKGYGAGRFAKINEALFKGNSDAQKHMLAAFPVNFTRLLKGQELSDDELCAITRELINIQAKAEPKHVGPPFRIATIYPSHPIKIWE
jgi:hypothetical protein